MKNLHKNLLIGFSLCMFAVSTQTFAGGHAERSDTTWPLRLAGDSTWPLRFQGGASNSNENKSAEVDLTKIDNIPSQMGLNCTMRSSELQQHKATGQIILNRKAFSILGVCFAVDTSMMEFISKDSTGKIVSMIAKIPQNPAETLRGHLRIDNKTYNVTVKRH